MDFFFLDESVLMKGKYCLRINGDNPNWKVSGRGNFNILPARVLGMNYYDYLIFCKEKLGAYIVTREVSVPIPMFKNNQATKDFVAYLNSVCKLKIS